jgi:hypothetical protein
MRLPQARRTGLRFAVARRLLSFGRAGREMAAVSAAL